MEIERVLSGDLNKNIEQCVTLLQDVERKTHNLKAELAQSLVQLQASRGIATPSSILGYAPQTQVPYAMQPIVPTTVSGIQALPSTIPLQSIAPIPTQVFSPTASVASAIVPQVIPQATVSPWTLANLANLPWQNFLQQSYLQHSFVPQGFAPQGFAPQGFAPQGFAPQGFAPQGFVPVPTLGTFAPFGVSPVASMQHYGYI